MVSVPGETIAAPSNEPRVGALSNIAGNLRGFTRSSAENGFWPIFVTCGVRFCRGRRPGYHAPGKQSAEVREKRVFRLSSRGMVFAKSVSLPQIRLRLPKPGCLPVASSASTSHQNHVTGVRAPLELGGCLVFRGWLKFDQRGSVGIAVPQFIENT